MSWYSKLERLLQTKHDICEAIYERPEVNVPRFSGLDNIAAMTRAKFRDIVGWIGQISHAILVHKTLTPPCDQITTYVKSAPEAWETVSFDWGDQLNDLTTQNVRRPFLTEGSRANCFYSTGLGKSRADLFDQTVPIAGLSEGDIRLLMLEYIAEVDRSGLPSYFDSVAVFEDEEYSWFAFMWRTSKAYDYEPTTGQFNLSESIILRRVKVSAKLDIFNTHTNFARDYSVGLNAKKLIYSTCYFYASDDDLINPRPFAVKAEIPEDVTDVTLGAMGLGTCVIFKDFETGRKLDKCYLRTADDSVCTTYSLHIPNCSGKTVIVEFVGDIRGLSSRYSSGDILPLFKNVTNVLTPLPEEFVNGDYLFYNSRIEVIPNDLFGRSRKLKKVTRMFSGSKIFEIPENLFSGLTQITAFDGCFSACKRLVTIPENVFETGGSVESVADCFSFNIYVGTNIPEKILEPIKSTVKNVSQMFLHSNDSYLSIGGQIIDSTAISIKVGNCPELTNIHSMFWYSNFKSITLNIGNAPKLNAGGWLCDYCHMVEEISVQIQQVGTVCDFNRAFFPRPYVTSKLKKLVFKLLAGKVTNLDQFADGQGQITSALPTLWSDTVTKNASHTWTFRGCFKALNYSSVPDDWS